MHEQSETHTNILHNIPYTTIYNMALIYINTIQKKQSLSSPRANISVVMDNFLNYEGRAVLGG